MSGGVDDGRTVSERALGVDLGLTAVCFAATVALVWVLPAANPVRVLAAFVGLLLVPGYALTLLVFPARAPERARDGRDVDDLDGPRRATLADRERAALSFGLSVALVPLYGYFLSARSLAFDRPNAVLVVVGATVALLVLGGARRLRTDPRHRYVLPLERWRGRANAGLEGDSTDVALNVGLALAVLLASASFAGAIVAPPDGSTYTQATLLTEQPNGELAASGYETELATGESTDLVLQITNHEGEAVDYTAFVVLQRLDEDGTVVVQRQVDTLNRTVADGERWRAPHTVPIEMAGERVRIAYLVYRGDPPATLTVDSAYRHLSLSLSVEVE